MVSPQSSELFLEALTKSGLVTPRQIEQVTGQFDVGEVPDAAQLAQAFVREGLLTSFQVERLLSGRFRGFFVDRYKVCEILGAGGMGWLYAAVDQDTGQRVAIKVLSSNPSDAGVSARFRLEGQAGLRLNHPNIVRTIRVDCTDELQYIVMELLEGISLQELIDRQGPVPWQQACDMICQAAAGLQYAHDQGMVHRDVKPGNLLVDHEGHIKVLDFGLALCDDQGQEFSMAMIFGQDKLGTADYVAPEQSLDSYHVDGRADIYSLGCTFYFILTGKVPFPLNTIGKKLDAHRRFKPRPLEELAPDVPPEVVEIVSTMMAKRAERRYASCTEVCRAVAPFAQRKDVQFDFRSIVNARAIQAERRAAAKRKQISKSNATLSSVTQSRTSTVSLLDPLLPRLREVERPLPSDSLVPVQPVEPAFIEIKHRDTGKVLLRMEGGSLAKSDLAGADLSGADLAGMDLSGASLINTVLRGADLSGARLVNATMSHADLTNANCRGADFSGADISNGDFTHCQLHEALLVKANLRLAKLIECDATDANFSGADLSLATLQCRMQSANLSYANLKGADCSNCNLRGAKLAHADFTGGNLKGAVLVGADLTEAKDIRGLPFPKPKPPKSKPWWKFWG